MLPSTGAPSGPSRKLDRLSPDADAAWSIRLRRPSSMETFTRTALPGRSTSTRPIMAPLPSSRNTGSCCSSLRVRRVGMASPSSAMPPTWKSEASRPPCVERVEVVGDGRRTGKSRERGAEDSLFFVDQHDDARHDLLLCPGANGMSVTTPIPLAGRFVTPSPASRSRPRSRTFPGLVGCLQPTREAIRQICDDDPSFVHEPYERTSRFAASLFGAIAHPFRLRSMPRRQRLTLPLKILRIDTHQVCLRKCV